VVDIEAANSSYTIAISKGPDPVVREPFVWRAGLPILIVSLSPGIDLTLEDWLVHASTQPSDSRAKARLRWHWTWLSWTLLALALTGTAVSAWRRPEAPTATGRVLVQAIVKSVTGKTPEQTAQLRGFLQQILLESVPVQEALDGLKIPTTPAWVRAQFVARARRVFLARIAAVKAELDAFGARLA
jgi:hypothetical protein